MPRKPHGITIEHPPIDEARVSADLRATDRHHQQLARVDEKYGDGMPYDRARLISEARFYLGQSAEAMFESGKRLVMLKEHEPHGEFIAALGTIGIDPRMAQLVMRAAVKIGSNTKTFSHLGRSKVLELAYLDDDELAELADGGSVADLSLDEIDRMSVRELRERLRREKAERERDKSVHERVLRTKTEKIDEYEKKLARRDSGTASERMAALIEELWGAVMDCGAPLLRMEQIFQDIGSIEGARGAPEAGVLARGQALAFLTQTLLDMQERHQIEVDLESRITPPWMKLEKAGQG